jgi:hypothetical protein
MNGVITMSCKELNYYRHAMNVLEGKLSIVEFALLINKSYRQAQRIINKIKLKNQFGAIHGNKGKSPVNKTNTTLIEEIQSLYKSTYHDFNLIHFIEMLREKEGLNINYSTLYRYSRKAGLIKHQKRRKNKKHCSRPRLPREGMLIQFDGSEHRWFGDITCDLIAGIDDATGKILSAEFFIGETSLHSMQVIKNIVINFGVPEAFYMDEAAIFGKRDRDWNSQIARALETLGSKLILAGSAQAKGRVERLFKTLQDRLIAELRLGEINTLKDANNYLKYVFIPKFNEQFGVKARENEPSYKENLHPEIDNILCRKITRKVTAGNTFSYEANGYKINGAIDYRFRTVNINTHIDGSISFDIMNKKVSVDVIEKELKMAG